MKTPMRQCCANAINAAFAHMQRERAHMCYGVWGIYAPAFAAPNSSNGRPVSHLSARLPSSKRACGLSRLAGAPNGRATNR